MRYKVGDKVRIKREGVDGYINLKLYFRKNKRFKNVEELISTVFTVEGINETATGPYYKIKDFGCYWNERDIKPYVDPYVKKSFPILTRWEILDL